MRTRVNRLHRGVAVADSEALQTDVMRFIAIIGLCLAAIFSLMRGISPTVESQETSSENEVLVSQMENLQSKSSEQQQTIELLQEQLKFSAQQISSSQEKLVKASQQEQKLLQVNARNVGLSKSLSMSKSDQLLLEKKLLQAKKNSRKLERQLKVLKQPVVTPQPVKAVRVHEILDAPVKPVKTVKLAMPVKTPEPVPSAKPVKPIPAPVTKVPAATPVSKPKPQQQGFALKFSSDHSLDKLIRNHSVELLALFKQQAWQLDLSQSKSVLHKISMPRQYHEMLPSTVPYRYQQALKRSEIKVKKSSVTWAVQLSSRMEKKIQSLVRTAKGGDLVIHEDGNIILISGGIQ